MSFVEIQFEEEVAYSFAREAYALHILFGQYTWSQSP